MARWCNADFVGKRVAEIRGAENRLVLEDGQTIDYDVLAVNVGSRTRGANDVKGVKEQQALTTRPINDLLHKIEAKEKWFLENKMTP